MKKFLGVILLAVAAAAGSGGAVSAASLNLPTTSPIIGAEGATVTYVEGSTTTADLFSLSAAVTLSTGLGGAALTVLNLSLNFDPTDPMTTAAAFFSVQDGGGTFDPFLESFTLAGLGFVEDVIEIQFGNLAGTGAGNFNGSVLMTVAFADPDNLLGSNPFADLEIGDYTADITVANVAATSPQVIPLPAAMPLLAGALLGFGGIARRRRAA